MWGNFASRSLARTVSALKASVELSSDATQFPPPFFDTDDSGLLSARTLPFGLYSLRVEREGFSIFSGMVEYVQPYRRNNLVHLSVRCYEYLS